jgi:hypothetical protein
LQCGHLIVCSEMKESVITLKKENIHAKLTLKCPESMCFYILNKAEEAKLLGAELEWFKGVEKVFFVFTE